MASADSLLQFLAHVAHQSRLFVRLGVARFGADVSSKSRVTDLNTRIGAFEIQVSELLLI